MYKQFARMLFETLDRAPYRDILKCIFRETITLPKLHFQRVTLVTSLDLSVPNYLKTKNTLYLLHGAILQHPVCSANVVL